MKRQIRRNVFETNSSSTHSICITKNDLLTDKRTFVDFTFGEFGWECDTLTTVREKASYLYTGIYSVCYDDDERLKYCLDNIRDTLSSNGINCEFEGESKSFWEHGYIDHGNELNNFVNDLVGDNGKLMRYLFSDESFVITGNDNDDEDVNINVSYEYDEYYKGN